MSLCSFYILHVGSSRYIGRTFKFRDDMYTHYDRAYVGKDRNITSIQYAMRNFQAPSLIYGEEIAKYSRCSSSELLLLENMYIHRHGGDLNSFGRCCIVDYKYARYLEDRMMIRGAELDTVVLQDLYDDMTFQCIIDDITPA